MTSAVPPLNTHFAVTRKKFRYAHDIHTYYMNMYVFISVHIQDMYHTVMSHMQACCHRFAVGKSSRSAKQLR